MAGRVGNYLKLQTLKDWINANGPTGYDYPDDLEVHYGVTSFDADGTGTIVPGSVPAPINNDATLLAITAGRIATIGPITSGARPTGGNQVVKAVKITEVGQPTRVYYYGDLDQPVSWEQGGTVTIPAGFFSADLRTA